MSTYTLELLNVGHKNEKGGSYPHPTKCNPPDLAVKMNLNEQKGYPLA